MTTKPSRKKLEAPLFDPSKRKNQRLFYTVPVKVDYMLQDSAELIGMSPERYIQTAIMDANRFVRIWDYPGDQPIGYIQAEVLKVLQAKRPQKGKPTLEEADDDETVEVTVQLPKAFVETFKPLADAIGISLAEASRFIVEDSLPQHFSDYKGGDERGGDKEAEMHMLRHVLGTRPRDTRS